MDAGVRVPEQDLWNCGSRGWELMNVCEVRGGCEGAEGRGRPRWGGAELGGEYM